MTLVAGGTWTTLVTLVAGVTWITLVAQVTWMMTLVAGVSRMTLVALVARMATLVLVTMATLAVDTVCLVGTSYGGFPMSEEIPFQLDLHLLQSLQLFWADVPGFHMAYMLVSPGALQHGVRQVMPLGIDLLGTSRHSSPCGILHGRGLS